MTVEKIPITSRDQWLELRKRDVTASVVGALFGLHPWQTIAGVWAEKTGLHIPDIESAVLLRGELLEPVVAEMVKRVKPEWHIEKSTHYLRDPERRFGGTPDYVYVDEMGRNGVLQIKTVSPQQYSDHWDDVNPPLWVTLQTLAEMMLWNAVVGSVGVLVIDAYTFDLYIYDVPRHTAAEVKILSAIDAFWASLERGNQPDFDPARDGQLVRLMFPTHRAGKFLQLSTEDVERVARIQRFREAIRVAGDQCLEDENALRKTLGDAEGGIGVDKDGTEWSCTCRAHDREGYTVEPTSVRPLRVKRIKPHGSTASSSDRER